MKPAIRTAFIPVVLLHFVLAIIYSACDSKKKNSQKVPSQEVQAVQLRDDMYAGEITCKKCHPQEYADWKGSHHDLAMMKVDTSSVLADFNHTSFTNQDGMKTGFYRKENEYWVNTQGPDGKYYDYQVVFTFGITPLQQYIVKFPDGKFQCLSTAWDTIEKKWFDLYSTFHVLPDEWLHQTRGAMNWNTMCADCHSTNVRKNYFEKADSFNTQFSIINVSCEACHGPGKLHAEKAEKEGYFSDLASEGLYLTAKNTPHEQVDQCARCHSRREQLTLAYNHQGSFLDHYYPRLLDEGAYHGDGQILDEVYVYGSFVQSKMYHNDVRCSDCHNPHNLKLKLVGNALCLQCHEPAKYDVKLHTFHRNESEGSQCINCHMTGKLYMVNDYRRDHSFRIPRPDLSIKFGSPNACNQCHTDKSNEWTYDAYKKWYGPVDSIYYTDILSIARSGDPAILDYLIGLCKSSQYPAIVRATGLHYLSRYTQPEAVSAIETRMDDSDPLVRAAAADALNEFTLSPSAKAKLLALLNDEKKAVRIKAFKAVAALPSAEIPVSQQKTFERARKEYLTSLQAKADFSGGQTEKAIYYQRIGQNNEAIKAYLKALDIDNRNNPARNNLANLYYEQGNFIKAEEAFRKIVEQEPEHGQSYYSLGLLLSEKGEYEKAIPEFKNAIRYMPEYSRLYYNLGLIYQNLQRFDEAENTFLRGLSVNPKDEGLLYALVYFYANVKGNAVRARSYLDQLVVYYPQNQEYRNLLEKF